MSQPGFLYVLANRAMPGLFKVGMTTREPKLRIRELSNATGVPSPFFLLYQQRASNCVEAERLVHRTLENVGYRESGNREFFRAPLHQVLAAVALAIASVEGRGRPSASISLGDFVAAQAISELATEIRTGSDRLLADGKESLLIHMTAAEFGHPDAATNVGLMMQLWPPDGTARDPQCAMTYYRKAIDAGNWYAHAHVATCLCDLNRFDEAVAQWRTFFSVAAHESRGGDMKELAYKPLPFEDQLRTSAWLLWAYPFRGEGVIRKFDSAIDDAYLRPIAAPLRSALESREADPDMERAVERVRRLHE